MFAFTGKTHAAFAAALFFILFKIFHSPLLFVIPVLLGSLFPDIDHPYSTISKKVPMGAAISIFLEHRGFTHTLLALFVFSLFLSFIDLNVSLFFAFGYITHLFLDFLTPSGIKPFAPFFKKKFSANFIKTGSAEEMVFLLACLYVLLNL